MKTGNNLDQLGEHSQFIVERNLLPAVLLEGAEPVNPKQSERMAAA